MTLRTLLLAPMLALGLSLAGCGDEILTAEHPGWKSPLCFDCHGKTEEYPHGDTNRREPDCRGCHGENGAPQEDHAADRQSCTGAGCHTATGHLAVFSAPTDCAACHAP